MHSLQMPSATTSKSNDRELFTLSVFSLNCWGLKFVSKHRSARISAIAHRLANTSPPYDIVALQELWVYSDYLTLRHITSSIYPHGKFYHSGVLGSGLVILSQRPIVSSSMHQYTLNGRPTAFWRGDWYVGKGVANAVIDLGYGRVVEVFNTHLHAPYEAKNDSYLCHRTAQAWEISKLLRGAVQKGHIPIALGDFNMLPSSLAHHIITTHGLVSDSWLSLYPKTPLHPSSTRHASYNIETLGTTCDSVLNTWRMPKGSMEIPQENSHDPRAKRLDYIFHNRRVSTVSKATVGCREPIKLPGNPNRGGGVTRDGRCSLSDHFSVEVEFRLTLPPSISPLLSTPESPSDSGELITLGEDVEQEAQEGHEGEFLSLGIIDEIQRLTDSYTKREQWEYKWRILHFWISIAALIGLHLGVWWGAHIPGVAFLCTFLAWVIAVTGVVNGLIGFLFMGSELNALKEFSSEISLYKTIVQQKMTETKDDGVKLRFKRKPNGAGGALSSGERIGEEVELEGETHIEGRHALQ